MNKVTAALLIAVGIINLFPVAGALSAGRLSALYGIAAPEGDLEILLRHRAVLFAIVGGLLVAAAFHAPLRWAAIAAGLVSMLSFVGIALAVGEPGPALRRIVWVDVVASVALAGAAALIVAGESGG